MNIFTLNDASCLRDLLERKLTLKLKKNSYFRPNAKDTGKLVDSF